MSAVKELIEPALVGVMSGVGLLILFAVTNGATRLVFGKSIEAKAVEIAGGARSKVGEAL